MEATDKERQLLKKHNINVIETKIKKSYGDGHLRGVELEDGTEMDIDAIFFNTGRFQTCDLPKRMDLPTDERGDVITEPKGNVACIHGLFVAGNASISPLKLVMTAASQGAVVGAKVNSFLMYEELGLEDGDGDTRYAAPLNVNEE